MEIYRLFTVARRESGAIIAYLVEKYDQENKISVPGLEGKYHQFQWLMFQASGQG
jgi:glutathione S-transferase